MKSEQLISIIYSIKVKQKTVESVIKSKESAGSLYKSHISTQKQQNKADLEFLKNQNFKNDPQKDKKQKNKKIESLEQNLESLYDSSNLGIPAFESKQFVQVDVNQTLKNVELNNKENNQIADSQMVSHSILKNSNKFHNNITFNQNKEKDNNQQFSALNSKNNSTKIKHSREQDLSMSRQESENLLQSFQIKKNDSFFEDCTQLDQQNDQKKDQQSYKELKRKKTVHYGDEEEIKASDNQFNDFVSNLSNFKEQQDDLQPSPNKKDLSKIFKNSVRMSVNLKQLTEKYNRGNTLDKSHQNYLEKVQPFGCR
ncbi:hypothetical protein PPERSA_01870 [Pseudocohnilembus persalinus]|uniref:Uncharacterized protein n=1 Tax=Pseudocohnilembus persalinus TaxID=266149 RepID=A0A0V0R269_PSEPJ|nr:hypothetical protein PPERSA_01870 [Pseudocohnilembus persalinus]|eukprot:KRX08617.1 hypothetical protein PPERSA_01870 [Pseudocohnilembus persalinus]